MEDHGSTGLRRIYVLGPLRVHDAAGPREVPGPRLQSLLTYLVLHPAAPLRREFLADLVAPDEAPARARRLLSDSLYRLRKCLGPGWLTIERDTVALRRAGDLWVDVWAFDQLAASEESAELQEAVELYAGDLAASLYDDWLLPERELRRNTYLSALQLLAARYELQGNLQQALLIMRRLILAEPFHEEAHQAYLRLLGRLQRPGEAIAHFEYLQRLLRSELGAEPLPATQALVEALRRERDLAVLPAEARERTAFVGRAAERGAALALVEAALAGRGAILAIEGEAGMGKSRLLREVAAGARWRGAAVYEGAAPELPDAAPLAPLARALAPLLHSPRGAQLEALLPAEALAALAPLHPAWGERADLRELPPLQARARLFNALHLFGATIAQLKPLVLALDDMQWADSFLWDCLPVVAQSLTAHGALLLLAYRRPAIEATTGWELLQRWDRDGLLSTIALRPLGVDDVAQLVGAVPGADPVAVHGLTGGSPFLIGEWLDEPLLERPAGRSTAERRLRALAAPARAALEAAAVVGTTVPYHLWAETAGVAPLALAALSEELARQHWLQPAPAGYSFVHDLTRAAVYDAIEPARRRALHLSAARAYRSVDPGHARAYAFHLDQGGRMAEAARAYYEAGRQSLAQFAFREAQRALDRALSLMPAEPTAQRIEVALALAQACETTGDRARQGPALAEALAGARRLADDALLLQALLIAGNAANQTSQLSDAEAHLRAALQLAQRRSDRPRETYAIFLLGDLCLQRGGLSDAAAQFRQALALAREIGDAQLEGRSLRGLGIASRQMGSPRESVAWLEQALAVHRWSDDRWSELVTQSMLLGTWYELGAWDTLIATAEQALPVAEQLGDHRRVAEVWHLQGLAHYALGDYANARLFLTRSEHAFQARGHRRMAGLLCNCVGLVAEEEGQLAEALQRYRAALATAEAMQASVEAAYVRHDLGALLLKLEQPAAALPYLEAARAAWIEQRNQLQRLKSEAFLGLGSLATGQPARAATLAAEGLAVLEHGVPLGEQPQGWLWALYRLLLALGRPEAAGPVLRAAYAELQRQARTIGDAELRRSFFERVPLNRAIVAAHDALGAAARRVAVSLARRDAPLGRTLQPDEYVTVQWTLDAPEDASIIDKAERRQYRLRRLLQEAEAQGGAPTDDDLARALGVSRRTILRDMDVLAQAQQTGSTRKRRRASAS